jgi:hypothetical protein
MKGSAEYGAFNSSSHFPNPSTAKDEFSLLDALINHVFTFFIQDFISMIFFCNLHKLEVKLSAHGVLILNICPYVLLVG